MLHNPTQIDSLSAETFSGLVLTSALASTMKLDNSEILLKGQYFRDGADLKIEGIDGQQILIINYFANPSPPTIITNDGVLFPPDLIALLTNANKPIQYAENGSTLLVDDPIGIVETALGELKVTRASGDQKKLSEGDSVYQGDILETGTDGAVGITFADGSTFSLGNEGRMVLDELIYDPATNEGSSLFSVVQGVFVFVSGEIASDNPDAMIIRTPVSTLGIRGTKVAGRAAQEGELNTITLMPDSDGIVGSIIVSNSTGTVTLQSAFQTTVVSSSFEAPAQAITLSGTQASALFGSVNKVLPRTAEIRESRNNSDENHSPSSREAENKTATQNTLTVESEDGSNIEDSPTVSEEVLENEPIGDEAEVGLNEEIIFDEPSEKLEGFDTILGKNVDELSETIVPQLSEVVETEEGLETELSQNINTESETLGVEVGTLEESIDETLTPQQAESESFNISEGNLTGDNFSNSNEESNQSLNQDVTEIENQDKPSIQTISEEAVYDAAWGAFETAMNEGQSLDQAASLAEGAAKEIAQDIYGDDYDEAIFNVEFIDANNDLFFEDSILSDGQGQGSNSNTFSDNGEFFDEQNLEPEQEKSFIDEFTASENFSEEDSFVEEEIWYGEELGVTYYTDSWGSSYSYEQEIYLEPPKIGIADGQYVFDGEVFDPWYDFNTFNAFGAGFDTFNVFLDPSIEKQQENDTFFFFPNESERFIPLLTVGNLQQLVNTDSAVTGPILTGLGLLLHSSGTFSFTFKETGQAFAGVGVINETDNAVSSGLLIDNIRINGILVQGFEDGTIGDISSIGSVSVEGFSGSIAPTQGSKQAFLLAGSTSQEDIESFLRLTPDQLDFNGVVDPTFGSALGAQFNVNAGDTLTYDFDFLDAESAGGKAFNFFKDFCFATVSEAFEGQITGTSGDDILTLDLGSNVITGLAGNDTISTGADDDFLDGGAGADTLDGGAGTDTVQFGSDTSGVTVNLTSGTATDGGGSVDTLSNIENVIGTAFADTLTGNSGANSLNGGAGNDTISGLGGADTLNGNAGTDVLTGGGGNDDLIGNTVKFGDSDKAVFSGDRADYTITSIDDITVQVVDATSDRDGTDTLTRIEFLQFTDQTLYIGTNANDTLEASALGVGSSFIALGLGGDDIMKGGDASDTLEGGIGNDTLEGFGGNDTLSGGIGNDIVDGNAGADTLTGGSGTDLFGYFQFADGAAASDGQSGLQTGDQITDFSSGTDRIQFRNTTFDFGETTGLLSSDTFFSKTGYDGTNSGASNGTAYIVFDTKSRTLYHDSDQASDGYTVIATVQSGATITNTDIELI